MKKFLLLVFILMSVISYSAFSEGSGEKNEKEDIVIAGIVFQNDLFMRTVQLGMESAGKKAGVTVLLANSDNKVDKEAQLIDTYIARSVDAIVITPLSEEGSVAALERAAEAGIKIVYFNTKTPVPGVAFVGTDNKSLGLESGKEAKIFISENLADKSVSIGLISFKALVPEQASMRTNGFVEGLNMPETNIVAEQDAWLAEQAIKVVGDILTANPNINVIHAANEGGTVGAVQAVKNAGKQGKVFVFGTDGSDQIAQMILSSDNILQVSTAQSPFKIGETSVEVALRALKGETVEKEIIVPPRVLKRSDMEDVKAFQEELKTYQ